MAFATTSQQAYHAIHVTKFRDAPFLYSLLPYPRVVDLDADILRYARAAGKSADGEVGAFAVDVWEVGEIL